MDPFTPESPAPTGFPYERLLAYHRKQVADAKEKIRIRKLIETDERWKAHSDSVRLLDVDRAAARQDGADLRDFGHKDATDFCRALARGGAVLVTSLLDPDRAAAGRWTRDEWDAHAARCVYCRRMLRRARARALAADVGEPLLREWLLEHHYVEALDAVTRKLVPDVPELAVLFTDMAGSTAFAETFGARAALARMQEHNRLLQPLVEEHHGAFVRLAEMVSPGGTEALAVELWVQPARRAALTRDVSIEPADDTHSWRIGDEVRLCVRVSRDCHLSLVNLGASGKVTVLLPNEHLPETAVRGGEVVTFPGPAAPFRYRINGPPGPEKFVALASSAPLRLMPADFGQSQDYAQPTTRDMKIVADRVKPAVLGRCEIEIYVSGP